jgi:hypothetical protein
MVPGMIAPSFNLSKDDCASSSCMIELMGENDVPPLVPWRRSIGMALRPWVDG